MTKNVYLSELKKKKNGWNYRSIEYNRCLPLLITHSPYMVFQDLENLSTAIHPTHLQAYIITEQQLSYMNFRIIIGYHK